jgi:hypothetical protein
MDAAGGRQTGAGIPSMLSALLSAWTPMSVARCAGMITGGMNKSFY